MSLGGEKIDAIQYSEDPEEYVANSLFSIQCNRSENYGEDKALAIVPNDQISLAIGKDGQNVRLAAKLTGWKIDVRGPGEESTEDTEDKEKKRTQKYGERRQEGQKRERR